MRARVLALLVPVCLLLVAGQVFGQRRVQEYTPPYEMPDKDLSPLYGRYEIYEADRYRGSISTTAAEAQSWVGQELIVTATLFKYPTLLRIENPRYRVWFYPLQPRYNVPARAHRWSSHYYNFQGQAPGNDFSGDEVIEVYKPGDPVSGGPWLNLEPIGTNDLWVGHDGWYYKARKTLRPVLPPGHDDYCQVMGPCSAGQGDCDNNGECQSELTCVDDVGATYGFSATTDVCEAPVVPQWVSPLGNLGPDTNPPPRVGRGDWAVLNFAHLVTGESPTGWNFGSSNPSVVQITQNNGSSTLRLNFLRTGSSRMTATASNSAGSSSRTFRITVSP